MTPEELKAYLAEKLAELKSQHAKVVKSHEDLDGRVEKIGSEIEKAGTENAESKNAFQAQADKVAKLEDDLDALVKKQTSFFGENTEVQKSLGKLCSDFLGDQEYKNGNMELATFAGSLFTKAVTSAEASAGSLIEPLVRGGIVMEPDQALVVRDLLTSLPISTNAIEWVQEKVFTNSAAPQGKEGDVKAESNITFEKMSSAIETIAHWMPLSRQVLADAPALQAFVNQRMTYGLKLQEEQQLLFGDGTNGNLLGLMPQATEYDDNLNADGDTGIDKMRRAILQVTKSRYPTNGIVMSPDDWCNIELTKTNENAYVFANPVSPTTPRLWGKRIVESLSMPVDQFLAGAFNLAATLWDREQVTARVAEQHADFFVKNMVVMLVEERLGLTVERPLGLVKGTISTTP